MSVDHAALAQLHLGTSLGTVRGKKSIEKVAQEFESLFLQQLLTVMRSEPDEDGLFEGNTGQSIYTSMMDQALARALSERGGIGLARPVIEQLERSAGLASEAPNSASSPSVETMEKRFAEALAGYRVTSPVGWRDDPFNGELRFHRGVDLAIAEGAPVKSLTSGRVVFSGSQGGFGNTILVEGPGGVLVRYAHLKELSVREGDEIAKGQAIGLAGKTGRATGSHLHLEVEQGGRLIDPLG